MAQFDLFRLSGGEFVVDLQTGLIGLDVTRLVAPLRREGRYVAFPALTPETEIDGQRWIVRVQEMAAVPAGVLGAPVGAVPELGDALLRAVDFLTHGF